MKKLTKKQILRISLAAFVLVMLIIYVIASLTYKYPSETFVIPKAINPIFVHFGDKIEIRWYAVCIIGGACLLSFYGYKRYLKPAGMDSDTIMTGVTLGILFGVLGGRLYYVAFDHSMVDFSDGFFRGILSIINPASGGLAIHGALYGAVIFIIVFSIVKHLKFWELIEIVLPVFMLAQVAGRWGNFFNQEAYGPLVFKYAESVLTDEQLIAQHEFLRHCLVPNFVVKNMYLFDSNYSSIYYGVQGYFHPTFWYEGCANFFGAVLYIELRKRIKKIYIGDAVCFYLTWYGFVRLFIELLRQDPLVFTIGGVTLKIAVLTSILFMVAGIALFIIRRVTKFHLVSCQDFMFGKGSIWKDGYDKDGLITKTEEEVVEIVASTETQEEVQEQVQEYTQEQVQEEVQEYTQEQVQEHVQDESQEETEQTEIKEEQKDEE